MLGSMDYGHTFDNRSSLSFSALYEHTLLGGPTTSQNLGWSNTSYVIHDEYNDNPMDGVRISLNYSMKPIEWGKIEWEINSAI